MSNTQWLVHLAPGGADTPGGVGIGKAAEAPGTLDVALAAVFRAGAAVQGGFTAGGVDLAGLQTGSFAAGAAFASLAENRLVRWGRLTVGRLAGSITAPAGQRCEIAALPAGFAGETALVWAWQGQAPVPAGAIGQQITLTPAADGPVTVMYLSIG